MILQIPHILYLFFSFPASSLIISFLALSVTTILHKRCFLFFHTLNICNKFFRRTNSLKGIKLWKGKLRDYSSHLSFLLYIIFIVYLHKKLSCFKYYDKCNVFDWDLVLLIEYLNIHLPCEVQKMLQLLVMSIIPQSVFKQLPHFFYQKQRPFILAEVISFNDSLLKTSW